MSSIKNEEQEQEQSEELEVDLSKPQKIWGSDDLVNFGKYRGESVKQLVRNHPDYLIWLNTNVSWFHLDEDLLLQCEERVERARDRQRISHPLFGEPDPFDDDEGNDLDYLDDPN